MSVYYEFLKNTTGCQAIPSQLPGLNGESPKVTNPVGVAANLETWQIILILIALGIFTAFIAKSFNWIRSHIYNDKVSIFSSSIKFSKYTC